MHKRFVLVLTNLGKHLTIELYKNKNKIGNALRTSSTLIRHLDITLHHASVCLYKELIKRLTNGTDPLRTCLGGIAGCKIGAAGGTGAAAATAGGAAAATAAGGTFSGAPWTLSRFLNVTNSVLKLLSLC